MERRYADLSHWTSLIKKRYKSTYIENEDLKGFLSIIHFDRLKEPITVNSEVEDNLTVADDGFVWLFYFPDENNYASIAMFNDKHELISLYYDICNGNRVSAAGIPYYDDLYLDIVLLPSGEVLLLDEDELKQALIDKDITREQFDSAVSEAQKLIEHIQVNIDKILNNSKKYLSFMLSLETLDQ